jgi:UDP-glucose 4-epimerase
LKTILLTGGAGYIGSHTCILLLQAGYNVVIIDNLCNSDISVLERIEKLAGGRKPEFVQADIRDEDALDKLFNKYNIYAVIHFAGLKAVGESVEKPLLYYRNNVEGSLCLFEQMNKHNVKRIVFSSSATVYGDPASLPITEDFPLSATNPYGQNKLMVENILKDISHADKDWHVILLRYFNPVGAHKSGLIGEDPNGIPNNLMPYVAQVAVGKLPHMNVFGDDYPTHDGTGVRDYIHVVDLASGHIKALDVVNNKEGCQIYNLGTGKGYSVLDVIKTFEKISGKKIPYKIIERREGDIAECYADPSLSKKILNWQAEFGMDEMIRDHWNWQVNNPNGYKNN